MQGSPELPELAKQYQMMELRTAAASNAVMAHSTYEAALLRQHLPGVSVHVVAWAVKLCETKVPLTNRTGMAFIGHCGHSPNSDTAQWLIDDIMPRVRQKHPTMTCLLAGSSMPVH